MTESVVLYYIMFDLCSLQIHAICLIWLICFNNIARAQYFYLWRVFLYILEKFLKYNFLHKK